MKPTRQRPGMGQRDWVGLGCLGVYLFYVPSFQVNQVFDNSLVSWLGLGLAGLAIGTNLRYLRSQQVGSAMLWAFVLCVYFSLTASYESGTGGSASILIYAEYTIIGYGLSMVVTERNQVLTVLAAVTVSAIVVFITNRGLMQASAEALDQAAESQLAHGIGAARMAGRFGNANVMGMYALVVVVAAAAVFFSVGKVSLLALLGLPGACAAYLAMLSGSRKAIVGMVFVLAFSLWLALRQRKALGPVAVLGALVLVIGGGVWLYYNPFLSRFDSQEGSLAARTALLGEAWESWMEEPILGLGYEGFAKTSSRGLYTHSTPFEMLCNGGIVAFGLYLAFWWQMCRSLRLSYRACDDPRQRLLLQWIACYLILFAIFSVNAVTYNSQFYLVLNGCFCGYLRSQELRARALGGQRRSLTRPGLALSGAALVPSAGLVGGGTAGGLATDPRPPGAVPVPTSVPAGVAWQRGMRRFFTPVRSGTFHPQFRSPQLRAKGHAGSSETGDRRRR